ncbi:cytochrome c oxidase accessory protein FixG [Plasticicumulans lactativorans]|uniref:Cytochrome c oxidase accessory protein FixG n=1 Tax=Plasticicumulans lactativorans TaxID=1133106 RepID=A0A4R2LP40_9GAMM|nr:cytochrome c oxidase accessory protein CcoG [Plasticicumulans lactativorans]TCO81238.1 cytochrome c oxidase accessory protein FixG [Plasticicumulans lactativorans]
MTAPNASEPAGTFYVKPAKIYPREAHGRFARLRVFAVLALLGLYYLTPWLDWGGRQAVLFDLPARKFYILGLAFWPQDFFFLALLLIIAAFSLFFFTALAGRLWCGYACPQTVWTETFMWIERWVEGDRGARMKLDKAPWDARKLRLKAGKHALWLLFAAWTGFTFVGFFTPIRELGVRLAGFALGPWELFWIVFYSFATWGNAGFMREQVCLYMCPYARFQSAMFDKNTLVISYDAERGEPRGSRKRGVDPRTRGLGDCIDCTLCVQVCPTGIDIRNGLQYQCIGCAACVDACDEVMDKIGSPRGLVRYTTENALLHHQPHVIRPRMLVYAALLLALTGGLVYAISVRTPLQLDVIRDRNALYRMTDDGLAENVYTLKILNMDEHPHRFALAVHGAPGMRLDAAADAIAVAAGEVLTLPVRVSADPQDLPAASSDIRFELRALDTPDLRTATTGRFLGPARR